MMKTLFTLVFLTACLYSYSQNTFPATGNVGIGTTIGGSLLTLNSTAYPVAEFQLNNQTKFVMGVAGGPNYLAPGSITGDFVFRSVSSNMLFTTNNDTTTMLALTSSGMWASGQRVRPFRQKHFKNVQKPLNHMI
jgi:hypothetical protein